MKFYYQNTVNFRKVYEVVWNKRGHSCADMARPGPPPGVSVELVWVWELQVEDERFLSSNSLCSWDDNLFVVWFIVEIMNVWNLNLCIGMETSVVIYSQGFQILFLFVPKFPWPPTFLTYPLFCQTPSLFFFVKRILVKIVWFYSLWSLKTWQKLF